LAFNVRILAQEAFQSSEGVRPAQPSAARSLAIFLETIECNGEMNARSPPPERFDQPYPIGRGLEPSSLEVSNKELKKRVQPQIDADQHGYTS
jgi:hypothetical protein